MVTQVSRRREAGVVDRKKYEVMFVGVAMSGLLAVCGVIHGGKKAGVVGKELVWGIAVVGGQTYLQT